MSIAVPLMAVGVALVADVVVPNYSRESLHSSEGVVTVEGRVTVSGEGRLSKTGAGTVVLPFEKIALANDFNLPESMATRDERCLFRIGELPLGGQYRFPVRPIECFGRKGRPIWNETPVRIG